MVPIAAEDYSGYDSRKYYSVAVARRTDSRLTIFNLKSRFFSTICEVACQTQTNVSFKVLEEAFFMQIDVISKVDIFPNRLFKAYVIIINL